MGDGDLIAVSDAGPFVHLAEVNGLLLLNIFARLHVPETVWTEVARQRQVTGADFSTIGNIQRHDSSSTEIAKFVAKTAWKNCTQASRSVCASVCRSAYRSCSPTILLRVTWLNAWD